MAGGSALLRRRPIVLGGLALLVAIAIAVTLAVTKPWASPKTREDVGAPAAGDRVLQSVDVTMQDDGSLTRVGDTVVIARAQGGAADTYTTTYDPTKVVDQLPVRVLTAYETDKGSGTNLADLKGLHRPGRDQPHGAEPHRRPAADHLRRRRQGRHHDRAGRRPADRRRVRRAPGTAPPRS